MRTREIEIGILFLSAILALTVMISRLTKGQIGSQGKTYYALLSDSSGLSQDASVRVAGIDEGEVTEKKLMGNQARLTLKINRSLEVRTNAVIEIRASGYLGDRYLDLNLGMLNAPILPEGSAIRVTEHATLENLIQKGTDFFDAWTNVAGDIKLLFFGK